MWRDLREDAQMRIPSVPPGECEDANGSCQQECGKAKKACGHPCEDRCHAPYACREEKPCQRKILITCDCQHLKQEIRCNASKNDEGNKAKTLKCDDECARLERNRKLALALEIDPETHKDNHIPYSEETLNYFRQNSKWAQTQERLFRVFAMDDEEKRLRFKPMPPPQRAFLHALAEDYGLDSESMDPEPHRHIAIFKTPRFVMAPMKTLGQCVEIGSTTAAAALQEQKRLATLKANRNNNETPYNAFLLGNPRFALTVEEVRSTLESTFASRLTMPFTLNINFLPSEEIVVRPSSAELQPPQSLESPLRALLPHLTTLVTTPPEPLATSIQLCHVDSSSNVLRREIDPNAAGGWSQVAAKAANSARASQAPERSRFGGGTVFTVLRPGGREKAAEAATAAAKAKKAAKEPVVDDWEKAVEEEEQKEEQRQRVQAQANDEVVPGVDQVEGLGSESQPVQEPNTLEPEQIVEGKEAAATQPHDHSPEPRVAVEGSDREAV
ncbi:MAG: 37S ribosomal protein S23 mitochondrial [Chaenotheca gracillima]|nr:MAG: 37S ribosomal protein S23 mitochondrial [Chaenotheca gracillima]